MAVRDHIEKVNHRSGDRIVFGTGVEYGQAPAGGEPEAAVLGAMDTTGDGEAGRALGAAQAIFYTVIHGFERLPVVIGEAPQFALGDAADTAGGAQPQRFAVIGDTGDVVAEQTVFGGEGKKLAIAVGVQAAIEGSDPEGAVAVLVERTDLIAGKAGGCREEALFISLEAPQTFAVGTGPDFAIFTLSEDHECAGQQGPAGNDHLELVALELGQAGRQGYPQIAGRILERVVDGFALQRVRGPERSELAIAHASQAAARADEQIAVTGLANREDLVGRQPVTIGEDFVALGGEQHEAGIVEAHPDVALAILVDRVGIVAGQTFGFTVDGENVVAQTRKAVVSAYP